VGEAREGGSDARVGTAIFFFAGREGDKWKKINGCFVMRSCQAGFSDSWSLSQSYLSR
jgi:hypothetical protein